MAVAVAAAPVATAGKDGGGLMAPDFGRDFKFAAGTTAITMFVGIVIALFSVLIISILHFSEKSMKVLVYSGIILTIFVVIAAVTRRPAYTMELLSYILVFGAIFIGFIYRADSAGYNRGAAVHIHRYGRARVRVQKVLLLHLTHLSIANEFSELRI
jgi:amino acid transporter